MSDVDRSAVRRETEALRRVFEERGIRNAFDYRGVSRDTDLLVDSLYEDMPPNPAGLSLGIVASEYVVDCYYERGALEPLVKMYGGHVYRSASLFERLLLHLEEARRFDLIERLWASVTRATRAEFFHQRPGLAYGADARVQESKAYALEAYTHAIDWMTRVSRIEAAERFQEEREAVREEQYGSLPAPTDLRRVDERVFWQLIVDARSRAATTLEQLTVLGASLRAFKGAEIKRFGMQYARQMKLLHHWNAWALAYAARGGCSDAAFEEFRTWVILQGDPDLVAMAVADPVHAAERVPPDPELPDGSCLGLIDEAYLMRTGSTLELPSLDRTQPGGREWSEAAFAESWPELMQHYDRRS